MASGPAFSTGIFNYTQGNYIQRVDYDINSNAIYLGWAQPGTANADPFWRIVQNTYDASNRFTGSGFVQDTNGNPSCGFAFIWANRASYSYS